MPNLGEIQATDDLRRYNAALAQRRRDAMREILSIGGIGDARILAKSSPVPRTVGMATAEVTTNEYEGEVLALLVADDPADTQVAYGYAARRFERDGWAWVERLTEEPSPLSAVQKARLFNATRDFPRAWEIAERQGNDVGMEFWKHFVPYHLGRDFSHVDFVAQRLLGVGRYAAALRLVRIYTPQSATKVNGETVARALEELVTGADTDPESRMLDQYDFESLLALLDKHSDSLGWKRVGRLQWAFLPQLGPKPNVQALHRLLSADPSFFGEVVSWVYKAKGTDAKAEQSPETIRMAANGHRLLFSWSSIPGLRKNGTIDRQELHDWICSALIELDKKGRREVGEIHIGQTLSHAPAASDGHWPAVEVRDILETLQSERIENGFISGALNQRGMTTRAIEDGGLQEQELAAKYMRQAENLADEWPRTAALLRAIADNYEHQAQHEEDSAERTRRGHER
jgi:hypothetical protein